MRDEKRTLECLKKAARIASQCMDTGVQVQICVELLNHYLFYFERGNSLITVDLLNQVCFFVILSCLCTLNILIQFKNDKHLILYFFSEQLIAKINEELPNLEQCEESKQIEVHYQNTLTHIRSRMKSTDSTGLEVSFEGITLN